MAFVVINSVKAAKEDLPRIIADIFALGLDAVRELPGFRSARLITAEDQTEVALIMEWESRDQFVAYGNRRWASSSWRRPPRSIRTSRSMTWWWR
jgi:heme-degrading monooxygenase HmoA